MLFIICLHCYCILSALPAKTGLQYQFVLYNYLKNLRALIPTKYNLLMKNENFINIALSPIYHLTTFFLSKFIPVPLFIVFG